MEKELGVFFNIFYEFITEKNIKRLEDSINHQNENDDLYQKYFSCFSEEALVSSENFDKKAISIFEKKLYDFIVNYRENNNTNFNLELLVKIGENNQILSKEDIGLISMIIMNKNS